MGYNRSGERRKQRLKRNKREINRIVEKLLAAECASEAAHADTKEEAGKSAKAAEASSAK